MNSKKELNQRSLSFGSYSLFITVVVICIVGILNFLGHNYPKKIDLTKNKIHTMSDQTDKVMKSLKTDLNATFFGNFQSKEKYRSVFDNYKKASNKFKFEAVDPNKEVTRTRTAGIKKPDTLVLAYEGKTSKVEDITEEKITNEIIKLTSGTKLVVCTILGHGEMQFTDTSAGGFAAAKKGLEDQSYSVKEVTLSQEKAVPSDCSGLVMMGANKALFPNEVKMLSDYLENGGRLVVGLDAAITQVDQTKEIKTLLAAWGVEVKSGIIIDPVSKSLNMDASVPIILQFNKELAIVKDFAAQAFLPFARPVDVTNPAPEGIKAGWIGKTTPNSWDELDMASIAKGTVQFNKGVDLQGPLSIGVALSGKRKDSKAAHETRIVAYGSSQFANNQFSRYGGNLDLFLNSVSWVLEDESMISIRTKEDEAGKVELTANDAIAIFLGTVVFPPLFVAIAGLVIWIKRKKL